MPRCSFCKEEYGFPRGMTVVQIDGVLLYFCSSKCRRNHNLKRDPKKTNWVKREKKVNTVVEEKKPVKKEKVEEKPKTEEKKSEKPSK